MQIYDVTLDLSPGLPVWPGDPKISLERATKIEEGANSNVTLLGMSAHAGTHVDAPYHFLGEGYATIEKLSLNMLTGRAYVLSVADDVEVISAGFLEKAEIPPRTRRLIFKTRNSNLWNESPLIFHEDFVGLSADGAQYLVEKGIRLVGIDYLSIAPYRQGTPTHRILLSAGIVILEGLNLSQVTPGRYTLYCLPLKLVGADGAPARAILIGV